MSSFVLDTRRAPAGLKRCPAPVENPAEPRGTGKTSSATFPSTAQHLASVMQLAPGTLVKCRFSVRRSGEGPRVCSLTGRCCWPPYNQVARGYGDPAWTSSRRLDGPAPGGGPLARPTLKGRISAPLPCHPRPSRGILWSLTCSWPTGGICHFPAHLLQDPGALSTEAADACLGTTRTQPGPAAGKPGWRGARSVRVGTAKQHLYMWVWSPECRGWEWAVNGSRQRTWRRGAR